MYVCKESYLNNKKYFCEFLQNLVIWDLKVVIVLLPPVMLEITHYGKWILDNRAILCSGRWKKISCSMDVTYPLCSKVQNSLKIICRILKKV